MLQALTDGVQQVVGRRRLLEEHVTGPERDLPTGNFRAVSTGVDDLEAGRIVLQSSRQLEAAQAGRHHEIRQQQRDLVAVLRPVADAEAREGAR